MQYLSDSQLVLFGHTDGEARGKNSRRQVAVVTTFCTTGA